MKFVKIRIIVGTSVRPLLKAFRSAETLLRSPSRGQRQSQSRIFRKQRNDPIHANSLGSRLQHCGEENEADDLHEHDCAALTSHVETNSTGHVESVRRQIRVRQIRERPEVK